MNVGLSDLILKKCASLPICFFLHIVMVLLCCPAAYLLYFVANHKQQPLWIRKKLSYTSRVLESPKNWKRIRDELSTNRGGTSLLKEPEETNAHRRRTNIWACDGNLDKSNTQVERGLPVTIVLSYPVHETHLVYSAASPKTCKTLKNVYKRLQLNHEQLMRILITDIYPFVGHPSALGKQRYHDEVIKAIVAQAENVLRYGSPVILLATEAARYAFARLIVDHNLVHKDETLALGLPACMVSFEQRQSLIIVEPHPSIDFGAKQPIYHRRAEFIQSIISGVDISEGETFTKR